MIDSLGSGSKGSGKNLRPQVRLIVYGFIGQANEGRMGQNSSPPSTSSGLFGEFAFKLKCLYMGVLHEVTQVL